MPRDWGHKSTKKPRRQSKRSTTDTRIQTAGILILVASGIVISRLFFLMVMQHGFYTALAAGSHEVYSELIPTRGKIYMQDSRTGEAYPVAMNRDYYLIFLDTRQFESDEDIALVTSTLITALEIPEDDIDRRKEISDKAKKDNDPYEPIAEKVPTEVVDALREQDLPGVGFIRRSYRFYPEGDFAGPIIGFVGKTTDGQTVGQYGLEGYFEATLAGSGGFFSGKKSASGLWIPTAGRSFDPPEDGADIYTTIDRQIQYTACKELEAAMEEYGATSASLVIMEPRTGAIRTMCSLPAFDPNIYNQVEGITVYNNTTIFTPYEVGSIFKPLVMAAAINEDLMTPDTYFYDSGSVEARCTKEIRNADLKIYEDQTMTGVLENSINTGMVHVAKLLGKERLVAYLERMGFGVKTGVELDTEAAGTIATLYRNPGDDIDCYAATASFGQGFTATPLQIVTAYSAIANGGQEVEPYIIERTEYASGKVERHKPGIAPSMFSNRTAGLVGGMMVSVVDQGHAGGAGVPGYYIAGKTGTAQIPGPGGYTEETNHSFIGYGPVEDPQFVMLVKFEKPQRRFSSQTAAPVFGKIASWLVDYYGIAPTR